jgi:large subunit ribosomal protein L15
MRLNSLRPAPRSGKAAKRVGRGIAAGGGKTCGRGQKGQHSRSGGYHKVGFEGGQMPLQRRLPKVGFTSRKSQFSAELRLHELNGMSDETIDLKALKKARRVSRIVERVKVISSGTLDRAVRIKGLRVSKGARQAIEAAGGSVED